MLMYNAHRTSVHPPKHVQSSHLTQLYTPRHQYYYSASLEGPPIRLDLRHNRLTRICYHKHHQQRLQLIFWFYVLDRIPSFAPVPLRYCFFGARVVVGWVALGMASTATSKHKEAGISAHIHNTGRQDT